MEVVGGAAAISVDAVGFAAAAAVSVVDGSVASVADSTIVGCAWGTSRPATSEELVSGMLDCDIHVEAEAAAASVAEPP